jgi:type IV pilus assembly protein PilW
MMPARMDGCRRAGPMGPGAGRQGGMGMIEMLIVILISLLMLMGLFSVVYGTRTNYLAQNNLAQLQDSERLAINLVTNVVQMGGYFPNPTTNTITGALPAVNVGGAVYAAGQAAWGSAGDQIFVRYLAGTADGVMDCNGVTNTTAAPLPLVNKLYVNASNQLVCEVYANGVPGTPQPLVNGVTGMQILYGVDTNGDGSVDKYIAAPAMTVANWSAVLSVQITLSFSNPLAGAAAPGAGAAFTPTLTRTINLLNRV